MVSGSPPSQSGVQVLPLRNDLKQFIEKHQLAKKWTKTQRLLEQNIRHPSLNVELLEPRWHGIYSFRVDRKYRALFFFVGGKIEVISITKHYQKG